jgi:hypothetical protein
LVAHLEVNGSIGGPQETNDRKAGHKNNAPELQFAGPDREAAENGDKI